MGNRTRRRNTGKGRKKRRTAVRAVRFRDLIFTKQFLFLIFFIGLTFLNSYMYVETKKMQKVESEIQEGVIGIAEACKNKSMFESANCVIESIKQFFYYNLSNRHEDLSFEELKSQGGVCAHYSKLYCEIGNLLGYNTKEVTIHSYSHNVTEEYIKNGERYNKTIEQKVNHRFCVWSSKEGYAILDQRAQFNFKYK